MLFNLLIAKARHSKPKVLTITIRFLLSKSIFIKYRFKKILANQPEIHYCLRSNRDDRLIELNATSFETKKIYTTSQANREYCQIFNLKTFNYLAIKNALKSQDSLLNLAKDNFESKIVETFIDRLNRPSPLQQEIIAKTIYSKNYVSIDVVSSFKISEEKRNKLITTIKKTITAKANIRFRIVIDSKSKIELHAQEFKIYWNLKYYLIEVTGSPFSRV